MTALPPVVGLPEWRTARAELLEREKAATGVLDAVAAARRRLPMVAVGTDYAFAGPDGPAGLLDLFAGKRQLIVYHFMMQAGSPHRCEGCSMFVDNMCHPAHVLARDTSLVLTSPAPVAQLESYRQRMGWSVPWYCAPADFNTDCEVGSGFGLSVFLRDGDAVFRTYSTSGRGVEHLGSNWSFLDLTPFGRQEDWEDSPAGWPQSPPYDWWQLHDEYDR